MFMGKFSHIDYKCILHPHVLTLCGSEGVVCKYIWSHTDRIDDHKLQFSHVLTFYVF